MGDVAKALGVGPTLEHAGKTYRLTPLSYTGQAFFETWLEGRAYEAVKRGEKAGHMTATEAAEARSQVVRDVAAGVYSFGTRTTSLATESVPGVKQLLLLCLLPEHPEADDPLVDAIFESKMAEVVAKLGEANGNPNQPAPASPGAA